MKIFAHRYLGVLASVLALVVCLPSYAESGTPHKSVPSNRVKPEGYKKEDCVMMTDACLVCPNASIVGPDLKPIKQEAKECLKKGRSKLLGTKISEVYFSKTKGKNCQSVSSLCALCPDGTFVSPVSDRELNTDLFECVHGPRAKQFVNDQGSEG